MRRDVSSHGYGICTAQQLYRFAEALGADKRPWVQLYCLACGLSRHGDCLGSVESSWLEAWVESNGIQIELHEAVVFQLSLAEVTAFFGGQRKTARRALAELTKRGLIKQISKGFKGHSSLYFLGKIEGSRKPNRHPRGKVKSRVEKRAKSTPDEKKIKGALSQDEGGDFPLLGDKRTPTTCVNEDTSIIKQPISIQAEPMTANEPYVYPALASDGRCLLCNECGYLVGRNNLFSRYECHGCNGANVGVEPCGKEQCGACDFAQRRLCA